MKKKVLIGLVAVVALAGAAFAFSDMGGGFFKGDIGGLKGTVSKTRSTTPVNLNTTATLNPTGAVIAPVSSMTPVVTSTVKPTTSAVTPIVTATPTGTSISGSTNSLNLISSISIPEVSVKTFDVPPKEVSSDSNYVEFFKFEIKAGPNNSISYNGLQIYAEKENVAGKFSDYVNDLRLNSTNASAATIENGQLGVSSYGTKDNLVIYFGKSIVLKKGESVVFTLRGQMKKMSTPAVGKVTFYLKYMDLSDPTSSTYKTILKVNDANSSSLKKSTVSFVLSAAEKVAADKAAAEKAAAEKVAADKAAAEKAAADKLAADKAKVQAAKDAAKAEAAANIVTVTYEGNLTNGAGFTYMNINEFIPANTELIRLKFSTTSVKPLVLATFAIVDSPTDGAIFSSLLSDSHANYQVMSGLNVGSVGNLFGNVNTNTISTNNAALTLSADNPLVISVKAFGDLYYLTGQHRLSLSNIEINQKFDGIGQFPVKVVVPSYKCHLKVVHPTTP